MRFVTAFALLAGIVLASGGSFCQEKKDPPKTKGMLPMNWGKLELTVDQKSSIYKVQAKYKDEIAKMEAAIEEKRAEQLREMVKILTEDQKKKLQGLSTGGTIDEPKKTTTPSKEK